MERIEAAWRRRTVVWLSGVRRAGKTVLSRSLPDVEYLDCELPSVRRLLADPESFLTAARGKRVVLDEVQRLPNPSETLKVAADHYPEVRLLATGSSTLQASTHFRDTLTGRKADIWLTPMNHADLVAFDRPDLRRRLQRGGLPPFFLDAAGPDRDFADWVDTYWARDIQELFRLERRTGFQRIAELLFMQSGGVFEATRIAAPCEISRTTAANYLGVLEATRVMHVVRPFSEHRATEIVAAPKVYGFDTGFVCYFRGWGPLRHEDLGQLWEHLVLNELQSHLQRPEVGYWRDRNGHEVDFVLRGDRGRVTAIECKWSASTGASRNLAAFRRKYPEGANWLVTADTPVPYERRVDGLTVTVTGLPGLEALIAAERPRA
ncbi:MAG: ATP-binding protein [Armatimonadetes bacterium]|nr:ATP-binding protein [Armatimonadota bacterium]